METVSIVFSEKQKVEVISESFDASLGQTEMLCAAICSLISTGTELQCLRGVFDPDTNWSSWVHYPFRPGYSMVAEVIEVGTAVQHVQKGDRVFVENSHTQYFKTESTRAVLLPKEIDVEEGAWINLSKTTQLGVRRAELFLGETVGVIGLGLLGQLVTQYLYLSGAKEVYTMDPAESRVQLVWDKPGIHRLAMDAGKANAYIAEQTKGKMLDVVFDITGHPAVLAQATQLVKPLGRVILLGDTATPSVQGMGRNVVSNSVSILGIHAQMSYKGWQHPEMAELFINYLLQGRMDVKLLISHRYSPHDAPQAYELLVNNRSSAMGVLFDWKRLVE
ncbi:zinc-binding dehydrogenase [Paenibacillus qinlingensis]|uniref:2-desacetyl-2-hydroxyethyl bacteriochlorophyllide A dehydrogenase n=1 Tax=Paenibacillus qinlingensis TaxID=1837343 RepID=A0ABU1NRX5_9BACL|nr:zinc-binding dehydrogenase [Paenibacillus qinlingensis]MDR6550230.1 2-desacetyl-2-hydroxyethyl bacteriochlorophyllide A dehydrogenase [Paenibacillus qinlingensis]